MRIGFRVDASLEIGTGHVMRCLTLADALRDHGAKSFFFCRQHIGNSIDLIKRRGYQVFTLPLKDTKYRPQLNDIPYTSWLGADWETDVDETCYALSLARLDWMIVDHYSLDQRWEKAMRLYCDRLMVVDDLADRSHDCDILLDQNLGRSVDDYRNLVPNNSKLLIGPQFALLRPEFKRMRPKSLARRVCPKLRKLLITMGGIDKDNVTGQLLEVLEVVDLPKDIQITVVMGSKAPWLEKVKAQVALMSLRVQVLIEVFDMASIMVESDLVIGAAGSSSWERCCLGLPTIQLVLAENQKLIASALASVGAAVLTDLKSLPGKFSYLPGLNGNLAELREISRAASSLTNGKGASTVASLLLKA